MSGIVGLVSTQPQPGLGAELEGMIQLVRRSEKISVDRAVGQRAAFASVTLPDSRNLAFRDEVTLVYFGEFYTPGELKQRLLHAGFQANEICDTADHLLELYLRSGWQGLTNLNGIYAVVVWDQSSHELNLITGRVGSVNLYYAQINGRLLFASEYKAIAFHPKASRQVDELGLATFFLYDQVMGSRTLMSGVHSAPPAAHITWREGDLRVSTYGDFSEFLAEARPRREEDLLAGLSHHIRQAALRVARPNSLLLLTSGIDSRLLAESFRIEAPEIELRTATVGLPDSREVRGAAAVAKSLGFAHDRLPIDSGYLALYACKATWRAEGKLSAYASWIYTVEPYLENSGLTTVYSGLNGNTITGRHYPAALVNARTEEDVIAYLRAAPRSRLQHLASVLRPDIFRRVGEASADLLADEFRRTQGTDLLARYDHQYYNNEMHRAGQKWDVFGDTAHPFDPLMDLDLVRYTLAIPSAQKVGKHLGLKLAAGYFPLTAFVPLGRTGRIPGLDMRLETRPALSQAMKNWRRLMRKVRSVYGADPAYNYIQPGAAMRGGSRKFLLDTLNRSDLLGDLFNMSAIHVALDDHLSGRRLLFPLLSSLLTFALWREQFIESRVPGEQAVLSKPTPGQVLRLVTGSLRLSNGDN